MSRLFLTYSFSHPRIVETDLQVSRQISNFFLRILIRMASQLRGSFKPKSRADNLEPDTREFIPTQVSPDISNFSSARLAPNDKGSCVKQELQTLWEMFTSWLKPETQSKEQMISQLVLEQFLKTGRYKDRFAVKEKWESSGRNLGTFMEGLTDECLKPPVMVSEVRWLG